MYNRTTCIIKKKIKNHVSLSVRWFFVCAFMFYQKVIMSQDKMHCIKENIGTWKWHSICIKVVWRGLKWSDIQQNMKATIQIITQPGWSSNNFCFLVCSQASERCHGMILSAYMLKPVQRIPSYRLLLIGEHFVCTYLPR